MSTPVVTQLVSTVDLVRRIAEQFHSDAVVVPFDLFSLVESQDGFGLTRGRGVSLIRGVVDDCGPGAWSLQLNASIAFDIPHRYEVEECVNLRNRHSVLGKYYCAITPDRQMSGVVWEMHIWSRLLDDIGGMAGQGIVHWTSQILRDCLDKSSDEAEEFRRHFGGRILEPTEKDMTTLYVASDG